MKFIRSQIVARQNNNLRAMHVRMYVHVCLHLIVIYSTLSTITDPPACSSTPTTHLVVSTTASTLTSASASATEMSNCQLIKSWSVYTFRSLVLATLASAVALAANCMRGQFYIEECNEKAFRLRSFYLTTYKWFAHLNMNFQHIFVVIVVVVVYM